MISPAHVSRFKIRRCVARRLRRGLSVIELLAATVISLIVMGATVQLFGTVGNEISNGRSNIELGDRIRSAVERLRRDLRGVTVEPRPWTRSEDAAGYIEIIKGPPTSWDIYQYQHQSASPGFPLSGYTQDGLFFTTRSRDLPFVGRVMATNAIGAIQPMTVESQVAEVAWFLQPTMNQQGSATVPPTYTLYRRMLLVLPGLLSTNSSSSTIPSGPSGSPPSIPASTYYDTGNTGYPPQTVPLCDISAHADGNSQAQYMILNSLADLTYRENRFGHFDAANGQLATMFPFPIVSKQVQPFPQIPKSTSGTPDTNQRFGEDVVLTNVLSFDVKVWDPWAQVLQDSSGNPLVPSDPGYSKGTPIGSGVYGAYVDLNWSASATVPPRPSGVPAPYFALGYYGSGQKTLLAVSAGASAPATYDTWPAGYEFYNTNTSPTAGPVGQSSNGFDDDGQNGVDDPNERITSPPYPVPLRGIQIKIRTYEFTSKQVREVTLQESFVPD